MASHSPLLQTSDNEQVVSIVERPSALHTRMLGPSQVRSPGSHSAEPAPPTTVASPAALKLVPPAPVPPSVKAFPPVPTSGAPASGDATCERSPPSPCPAASGLSVSFAERPQPV